MGRKQKGKKSKLKEPPPFPTQPPSDWIPKKILKHKRVQNDEWYMTKFELPLGFLGENQIWVKKDCHPGMDKLIQEYRNKLMKPKSNKIPTSILGMKFENGREYYYVEYNHKPFNTDWLAAGANNHLASLISDYRSKLASGKNTRTNFGVASSSTAPSSNSLMSFTSSSRFASTNATLPSSVHAHHSGESLPAGPSCPDASYRSSGSRDNHRIETLDSRHEQDLGDTVSNHHSNTYHAKTEGSWPTVPFLSSSPPVRDVNPTHQRLTRVENLYDSESQDFRQRTSRSDDNVKAEVVMQEIVKTIQDSNFNPEITINDHNRFPHIESETFDSQNANDNLASKKDKGKKIEDPNYIEWLKNQVRSQQETLDKGTPKSTNSAATLPLHDIEHWSSNSSGDERSVDGPDKDENMCISQVMTLSSQAINSSGLLPRIANVAPHQESNAYPIDEYAEFRQRPPILGGALQMGSRLSAITIPKESITQLGIGDNLVQMYTRTRHQSTQ